MITTSMDFSSWKNIKSAFIDELPSGERIDVDTMVAVHAPYCHPTKWSAMYMSTNESRARHFIEAMVQGYANPHGNDPSRHILDRVEDSDGKFSHYVKR